MDPVWIAEQARVQLTWDEFDMLIWQTRCISREFTNSLRKQQVGWAKEINRFYGDAIQKKLSMLGFTKPDKYGRQMKDTVYGCGGFIVDTGGRQGSIKIICFRAAGVVSQEIQGKGKLPYGSFYKQANWKLIPEDISQILDPIWGDWVNREGRALKIASTIEDRLVPLVLASNDPKCD